MGDSRKRSTRARRTAASVRLALALVLAVLAVGGIAFLVGRTGAADEPVRTPARPVAPAAAHEAPLAPVPDPDRASGASSAGTRPGEPSPERFTDSGRVRGELTAGEGIVFPQAWTLVLEPHPFLVGRERAVTKRVDHAGGEREFDSGAVPLGGYRVRAEAAGLNSTEQAVLLERGSSDVFVTLALRPAGLIDGRVLAADGSPAEGLAVTLEPADTQVRRHASVAANGMFVFREVTDGAYRLWLGPPESPLFPPADIVFQAPSMRLSDRTLPPTGAIDVVTVDARRQPVAGAEITGSGSPRGALRATSDFSGRALVRWLPPGTYQLEAVTADGRSARGTVEVTAGETSALELRLGAP